MRLVKLFLVTLLAVGSINAFGNTRVENKSKIDFLERNYSKALILQAIDQVLEYDGYKLAIIDRGVGFDYSNYSDKAEQMVMGHPNVVDIAFSRVASKPESGDIIDHVMNWCDIFTTVNQVSRLDVGISLEQILAENAISENIIRSFLTDDSQTWKNLSKVQLIELPYRVSNFLYKKSEEDRLMFYKDFYTKILEMSLGGDE